MENKSPSCCLFAIILVLKIIKEEYGNEILKGQNKNNQNDQ